MLVADTLERAVTASTAESTAGPRASAVAAWERFCNWRGVPTNFLAGDWSAYVARLAAELVGSFVAWEQLRGMAPSSVERSYLPAIAKHFDLHHLDNGFRAATNSPWVQIVLSGFSRLYYRQYPEGTRRRRAFTAESFPAVEPAMTAAFGAERKTSLHRAAEMLSLRMGVGCLLRKSEFLPCQRPTAPNLPSKWSRGLSLRDIHFLDAADNRVYLNHVRPDFLTAVVLHIRFSKTDSTGKGRWVNVARSNNSSTCLLLSLVTYILRLRDELQARDDRDDHCLFQIGNVILIDATEVTLVLKTTVTYLGMDPSKYTPHSMRLGVQLPCSGSRRPSSLHH